MPLSASSPSSLIVPAAQAESYLGRLGISINAIYQAAELGDLRASEIDEFHPIGAAGVTRWIGTVGGLRRGMVDAGPGWEKSDKRNRPTVERADKQVTLSVVGCDAATGDPESAAGPRADHRRGRATIDALNDQMELITVAALLNQESMLGVSIDDDPPLGQWFLLYHRGKDEVRLEVSKAAGIVEEGSGLRTGQFDGWVVRVMLDPYEPESVAGAKRPLDVGGGDVDFTIVPAL